MIDYEYPLENNSMPPFKISRRPNIQELKSQGDVHGLIEALSYQDDHNVRVAATSALEKFDDSSAVDPLITALDDQPRVKEVVALALSEIGDPRAVEPLIATLEDDNWEIRSTVAKALGKIGDNRAIRSLIGLLKDRSENVRWHAIQALEVITGESHGEDISKWEQFDLIE